MFIFFICFYADLKLPLFEVCGSIFKLALIITIPTFWFLLRMYFMGNFRPDLFIHCFIEFPLLTFSSLLFFLSIFVGIVIYFFPFFESLQYLFGIVKLFFIISFFPRTILSYYLYSKEYLMGLPKVHDVNWLLHLEYSLRSYPNSYF